MSTTKSSQNVWEYCILINKELYGNQESSEEDRGEESRSEESSKEERSKKARQESRKEVTILPGRRRQQVLRGASIQTAPLPPPPKHSAKQSYRPSEFVPQRRNACGHSDADRGPPLPAQTPLAQRNRFHNEAARRVHRGRRPSSPSASTSLTSG